MRLLTAILLAVVLSGCAAFVGVDDGDVQVIVISGTVTAVQLSSISDRGTVVPVTFVSLHNNGAVNHFAFCGDEVGRFPINSFVRVNFNPGQNCNQIVVVIAG